MHLLGYILLLCLSLLSPCTQIVCGILQLGFITQFLSDSLVSGYTCAAAFTIAITQIRSIFGLPRDIPRGGYFANVRVSLMYRSCTVCVYVKQWLFYSCAQCNDVLCVVGLLNDAESRIVPSPSLLQQRLIWYSHDLVLEPSPNARNWAAFVIALVCVVFLIATDYFNKFLRRKVKVFPIIIPAQVIVVSWTRDVVVGKTHV